MPTDLGHKIVPLISERELRQIVKRLADEIKGDFSSRLSYKKPLLLVGVLKGAVVFLSDLARALDIPIAIDFIAVSSYGSSTTSSGVVRILNDLDTPIEDRQVIIVEDIVDTGLTLQYLRNHLRGRGPECLRVCSLLDKPERREVEVQVDYCGMQVPNEFLVGYGLDLDELYRNLPFVGVVKQQSEGGS